jgi:tRNA-specific 2-thiouridylase
LANRATALGFDAVATGHYARTSGGLLFRGLNHAKDQSYVLAVAGPDRLRKAIFPLGEYRDKAEIRAEAARRGFAVSSKPDSFDICFIPDGDTRGFLRDRLGSKPGVILNQNGDVVGEHDGAYGFTVGQRKGLALGDPAADGRPRYVLSVDVDANVVVVGPKEALKTTVITARNPVWYLDPFSSLRGASATWQSQDDADTGLLHFVRNDVEGACNDVEVARNDVEGARNDVEVARNDQGMGMRVGIQVRAHGREVPAVVTWHDDEVQFTLIDDFLTGVAPGQSIVAYQGDRVVLQATVTK